MKKRITILMALTAVMLVMFAGSAFASTYSDAWKQGANGIWHIYTPDGEMVTNAWVCDDAVPENGLNVWYLIDGNGNMVTSGLVQDGTGNFYSLETNHNGYYGMLRYQSGTYGGIPLTLEASHNGAFASILNQDGIDSLKSQYGLRNIANIDNGNCVYTSSFGDYETETSEGESENEEKDYLVKGNEEFVHSRYDREVTDQAEYERMCFELMEIWCYARGYDLPVMDDSLRAVASQMVSGSSTPTTRACKNFTNPYKDMNAMMNGDKVAWHSYFSQGSMPVGIYRKTGEKLTCYAISPSAGVEFD